MAFSCGVVSIRDSLGADSVERTERDAKYTFYSLALFKLSKHSIILIGGLARQVLLLVAKALLKF